MQGELGNKIDSLWETFLSHMPVFLPEYLSLLRQAMAEQTMYGSMI